MSFDRFLLAVESGDLFQADKSIIRVSSYSILQNFNFGMIKFSYNKNTIWHLAISFYHSKICKIEKWTFFLSFSVLITGGFPCKKLQCMYVHTYIFSDKNHKVQLYQIHVLTCRPTFNDVKRNVLYTISLLHKYIEDLLYI